MENKEILEGNKLIAEFMGSEYLKDKALQMSQSELIAEQLNDSWGKFHTSWDWLMHVVEKIESLGYDFEFKKQGKFTNVRFKGIIDYNCKRYDNITAIYNAVVEFIKWYNENKNK